MAMRRLEIALFVSACVLGGVAGAGCATSRSSEGKRIVVVCEDHAITGTTIPRSRCYRRTELEERGEHDRDMIRKANSRGRMPERPQATTSSPQ
jgi:hypothetical protein